MKPNVCGLDRIWRLLVGSALLVVALRGGRDRQFGVGRTLAGLAGAELLATGLFRWCPGNHLLGIDTCGDDGNGDYGDEPGPSGGGGEGQFGELPA